MDDVENQQAGLRMLLEQAGISDECVLDVIQNTRRDYFVPAGIRHLAYDNNALPIGSGQTISQPYMVAVMTQELALDGSERILEVGTGSGYQAAILSQLCGELVTIERCEELATEARQMLDKLGYQNIEFRVGDGTLGCPDWAPFDGIIVTAGAPDVPAPLFNQLKTGGRLVIPVGDECLQSLQVIEKQEPEQEPVVRDICGCRFVKLIGAAGWPE